MIGPAAFGSRCWSRSRGVDAPRDLAALTNSRSRSVSIWPRTSRARSVQLTRPMARKMLVKLAIGLVNWTDLANGQKDVGQTGAERGGNDDHEQQVWKRVEHVGEAHQPVVDASAEVASQPTNRQTNDENDRLRKQRDRK